MQRNQAIFCWSTIWLALLTAACAKEPTSSTPTAKPVESQQPAATPKTEKPAAEKLPAADSNDLVRFSEKNDLWLDKKRKAVVAGGKICLREGQLEMFACPKGTKEHESIVALNCLAEEVHLALLGMKAKPGTTVKFDPEYQAATGDIIDIFVQWKQPDGTSKEVRAQELIKHEKTGKAMAYDWVFAGSGFYKDDQTGREHYQANGGDLICVSNFPTATLDLPVASTDANGGLLFTAFTENIPPKDTEVRVILVPRLQEAATK
jgi:hypothetical protein